MRVLKLVVLTALIGGMNISSVFAMADLIGEYNQGDTKYIITQTREGFFLKTLAPERTDARSKMLPVKPKKPDLRIYFKHDRKLDDVISKRRVYLDKGIPSSWLKTLELYREKDHTNPQAVQCRNPFLGETFTWSRRTPAGLAVYDLNFYSGGGFKLGKKDFTPNGKIKAIQFHNGTVGAKHEKAMNHVREFYGTYKGKGAAILSRADVKESSSRNLDLVIGPSKDGFVIKWLTTIAKMASAADEGKVKRNMSKFKFIESNIKGVFRHDTRELFKKPKEINFLEGDPFVWATVRDDEIEVCNLAIDENGLYHLQVYERKLKSDNSIALTFTLYVEGVQVKKVRGALKRVKT